MTTTINCRRLSLSVARLNAANAGRILLPGVQSHDSDFISFCFLFITWSSPILDLACLFEGGNMPLAHSIIEPVTLASWGSLRCFGIKTLAACSGSA